MRDRTKYKTLFLILTDEEFREIEEWKKQNRHYKIGRVFGDVILGYIRGKIPAALVEEARERV